MTDVSFLANTIIQTEVFVIALLGIGLLSLGFIRKNSAKQTR